MRPLTIAAIVVLDLFLVATALWYFAPRETWPPNAPVVTPGDDLDLWLAGREGVFDDITPGAEKRILWAGEPGARTPLALVYLHGFSATRAEIAPVPEALAATLGANLYETRLAGHGRPGEALGAVSVEDWRTDLAEAMAIARRLGERVVLIGTSTGGSLAVLAALDPQYAPDLAGLILVSPNFEVASSQAFILDLPFARQWAPPLMGRTRSWEPANEGQARFWTHSYPTTALFPMRALQTAARDADHAQARVPALVFYATGDSVVRPAATLAAMSRWGAPVALHVVTSAEDSSQHVIAGDILSPSANAEVIAIATDWLAAL